MAAIAWFLHNAASVSVQQVVFETRLRRVRTGDIVRRDEMTVPPGLSVADLVEDYLLRGNRRAVAVADNGRLVGVVTVSDIQQVPPEQRAQVAVGHVMGGRDGLVTVDARAPVQDAVELLAEAALDRGIHTFSATYLAETAFHGRFEPMTLALICALVGVAGWYARAPARSTTGPGVSRAAYPADRRVIRRFDG